MFKNLVLCMASLFPLAIHAVNIPASISYVQETPQDIQEALINIKERVPSETTIRTLAGLQQSRATTTKDALVDQQIDNDIHEIEDVVLEAEQIVLNMGVNPHAFNRLAVTMNELMSMLRKAGERYNLASDFDITIQHLNAWMTEVAAAPRTANFSIYKATLEKLLSEIVNILQQTKLVS